jgi:hypothetical protein
MIVAAPDKDINLPSKDAEFTLKEDELMSALKTAAVLQSPNIAFESDGKKVFVTTFNSKDDAAHTNTVEIAEGTFKEFKAVFLTENLKMIPGTYDVEISSKGLASFSNTKEDIDYFIAIEAKDSKF